MIALTNQHNKLTCHIELTIEYSVHWLSAMATLSFFPGSFILPIIAYLWSERKRIQPIQIQSAVRLLLCLFISRHSLQLIFSPCLSSSCTVANMVSLFQITLVPPHIHKTCLSHSLSFSDIVFLVQDSCHSLFLLSLLVATELSLSFTSVSQYVSTLFPRYILSQTIWHTLSPISHSVYDYMSFSLCVCVSVSVYLLYIHPLYH